MFKSHKDFNRQHYNKVTDVWGLILGDNLHWGYFENVDGTLIDATNRLIEVMASKVDIPENSSILDVGCGTGHPAFYLTEKYNCCVLGISTSETGISKAIQNCNDLAMTDKVRFEVSDAMDNGLPDRKFDLAWVMESSHLMRDKNRLFSECHRVLKENGVIILCDLVLRKEISIMDIFKYKRELQVLENIFGKAKMETSEFYIHNLNNAGFQDIEAFDISNNVIPTLSRWKENLSKNRNEILSLITLENYSEFKTSFDILEKFYDEGILGYSIFRGMKV